MLICNCSLAGTSSCLTCSRYLEEMRITGCTTVQYPAYLFSYQTDDKIIPKYKAKLQEAIEYFEQDVKEQAVSKDYREAYESSIRLRVYRDCLRKLKEIEDGV